MIDAKSFCKSGYDLMLRRRRIPAFIGILRELSPFFADSLPRQSFMRRLVWIRGGVQGTSECGWEAVDGLARCRLQKLSHRFDIRWPHVIPKSGQPEGPWVDPLQERHSLSCPAIPPSRAAPRHSEQMRQSGSRKPAINVTSGPARMKANGRHPSTPATAMPAQHRDASGRDRLLEKIGSGLPSPTLVPLASAFSGPAGQVRLGARESRNQQARCAQAERKDLGPHHDQERV